MGMGTLGRVLGRLGLVPLLAFAAGCASVDGGTASRILLLDGDSVTLPLKEGPEHLFSVEVWLEGEGPFRFMVDSGSEVLALDPVVAQRFRAISDGLPFRLRGALGGEAMEVPRGAIAEVAFQPPGSAGARIRDMPFVTIQTPHSFDGVAGLGLFRGCSLVLDFPREALVASVPERRMHPAPRKPQRLPEVTVRLAGVPVDVILDTGFPGVLYLPPEVAAAVPALGPRTGVVLLADVVGSRPAEERRLQGEMRLGAGGAVDPYVLVGEGGALVGTAFLRRWRISLDDEGRFVGLEEPR
jgi:hypothetical protein